MDAPMPSALLEANSEPATDPWSVVLPQAGASSTQLDRPGQKLLSIVLVGGLGAMGPVLRVADHSARAQRGSLVLFGVCVVWAGAGVLLRGWRRILLLGIGASAALVAVVPSLGRVPVLLAAAATVVAFAALVRWRPWPGHPQRTTPKAVLAVPFLAGAQIHWARGGAVGSTVGYLAASLAVVELASRWPARYDAADRSFARGVRRVADGAASVVLLIVLLPFLYLVGVPVAGYERIRRRRLRARSSWVEPPALSSRRPKTEARYPFVPARRAEVIGRLAVGLTLVVVVASTVYVVRREEVAATSVAAAPVIQPRAPEDPPLVFGREFAAAYTDLPAHAGNEWADELQVEETQVPQDGDWQGEYITVRDGRRVTIAPPDCDCREAEVWITGGSSIWGVGQRDEHTVASELVRTAAADGVALTVENFGLRGSEMEFQVDVLTRAIEQRGAPDLIVFVNGFNEIGGALADVMLRDGDALDVEVVNDGLMDPVATARMGEQEEINERVEEYLAADFGPAVAATFVERHGVQRAKMAELAAETGVAVRYYFQPDAFADREQLQPYELISGVPTDILAASPLSVALDQAARELEGPVTNLREIFDDEPSVFLGLVHHNERAAALIAQALWPGVQSALGP